MHQLFQIYAPLLKYIPEASHQYILEVLQRHPVRLKVTAPRKTRLGTYRRNKAGQDEISVNGDLNPYSFLITLIHELAHLIAFKQYGLNIAPHGKEWQKTFSQLLTPLLDIDCFPIEIAQHLKKKHNRLSASQCTDPILYKLLKEHEVMPKGVQLLKDLSVGAQFSLSNGMKFEKIKTNRTRAVCKKIEGSSKTLFTISLFAEVYPI